MNERMTHDLVGRALFRAVAAKKPARGLIHHSDRGSQYCSKNYQKLIKQFGIVPSMSRKGNCYDNAPMESWFGTLKVITEYIEIFYNRQRRHAKLGNISPAAFERKFYKLNRQLEQTYGVYYLQLISHDGSDFYLKVLIM